MLRPLRQDWPLRTQILRAAAAERFPKITLSGAIGLLSFALGDLFSNDALVGSLGAGIAGPLLDFGRVDAQIDQSKANAP